MNLYKLFDLSPFALVTIIFLLICLVGVLGKYVRRKWRESILK